MQCFLCKESKLERVYSLNTKKILRCRNDGLFLADAAASRKNNVYKADYFDNPPYLPNSNRSYFLKKIETIKQALRLRSGRYQNFKPKILDIGCGWGDFEEVLEIEKIPYLGIDASKKAVEICRKKGLNCRQITLDKLIQTIENGRLKIDVEDRRSRVERNIPPPDFSKLVR